MKVQFTKSATILELPKANIKKARQRLILHRLIERGNVESAIQYIKSFSTRKRSYSLGDIKVMSRDLKRDYRDELASREPNKFLDLFNRQFDASVNHKPSDSALGQWIGVEIECFINKNKFRQACFELGMPQVDALRERIRYCEVDDHADCVHMQEEGFEECQGHERDSCEESWHSMLVKYLGIRKVKRVSVKSDGSIRPDDDSSFPVELTIVFNRNDRKPLVELCKALEHVKAQVNKSCGMHVHLDQRDLMTLTESTRTRLLNQRAERLEQVLPFVAKLVPKSRRENTYCQLRNSGLRGNRYSAINLTAFHKYKTIEVRLHSATCNFEKINNWINVLLLVVNDSRKSIEQVKSLDDFCASFDVPERLIRYCAERIALFSDVASTPEGNEAVPREESAGQDVAIASGF